MSLLKKALFEMYRNDYYVLEMLQQLDYSAISVKFNSELHSRMTPEECAVAQAMVESDLLKRYDRACQEATLACTTSISQLLDLVMTPIERGEGMH